MQSKISLRSIQRDLLRLRCRLVMTNSNTRVAHSQQYLDTPSTWLLVCATVALSYLVPRLVTVLISNLKTVWPLWPGCAILVTGLLLVRVSFWPVLVAASFVAFAIADLHAGVPLRSIAWFIPGNTVEVLISAVGLRYCFDGVPRLNSVRAWPSICSSPLSLPLLQGHFLVRMASPATIGRAGRLFFCPRCLPLSR